MILFSKKRKRGEDDVVEAATINIKSEIARWRDDNNLGFTINLGRVIGEDWVNFDVFGIDRVNVKDVLRLCEIPSVQKLVAHLQKGALIVRVEKVYKYSTNDLQKKDLPFRIDTDILAVEKDLLLTCAPEDCKRVCQLLTEFKSKLYEKKIASKEKQLQIVAKSSPGVVYVSVGGLEVVDDECLKTLCTRGDEGFDFFINFEKHMIQIFCNKNKAIINST